MGRDERLNRLRRADAAERAAIQAAGGHLPQVERAADGSLVKRMGLGQERILEIKQGCRNCTHFDSGEAGQVAFLEHSRADMPLFIDRAEKTVKNMVIALGVRNGSRDDVAVSFGVTRRVVDAVATGRPADQARVVEALAAALYSKAFSKIKPPFGGLCTNDRVAQKFTTVYDTCDQWTAMAGFTLEGKMSKLPEEALEDLGEPKPDGT